MTNNKDQTDDTEESEAEDTSTEDMSTDDSDSVEALDQAPDGEGEVVVEEGGAMHDARQFLPVHAAPRTRTGSGDKLKVTRGRGRPRKVERMPTTSDLTYHATIADIKQRFIDQDPVVIATSGKIDAADLLRKLRAEIAKEASAIHFQRLENEKFGKDTSQTSSRRIDALTKIAHIELEIAKIGPLAIDVRSDKFQSIVGLFLEFIKEAASETLPPETLNLFFNVLETKMASWEERAEELIR